MISIRDIENETIYRRDFPDKDLGLSEANELCITHGLIGVPQRRMDGSNLVFSIGKSWLKIIPPFWKDSFEAEVAILKTWEGKLPVQTPRLQAVGQIGEWNYLVCDHVGGESYAQIKQRLSENDYWHLAGDLGALIGAISRLPPVRLRRMSGSWHDHVANCISNAENIFISRGDSSEWARRATIFLKEAEPLIRNLNAETTIHSDLNHAHLIFDAESRRLRGLIDFADAMIAPIEVEYLLPFLDCCRGNAKLQQRMIASYGKPLDFRQSEQSIGFMALTLLNRFIQIEDWFSREIRVTGVTSFEAMAASVFPIG